MIQLALACAALGWGVTAVLATINGGLLSVPPALFGVAIGGTLFIGAIAGLYPAIRAARLPHRSPIGTVDLRPATTTV